MKFSEPANGRLIALIFGSVSLLALLVLIVVMIFDLNRTPEITIIDTPKPRYIEGALLNKTPMPAKKNESTPTDLPTATPTSTPYIYPTARYTDEYTPTPIPMNEIGLNATIFVLLGSDSSNWREQTGAATDNTDAFMMVFVYPGKTQLEMSLISIPRDLYVFIPGYGMGRINTAWKRGGWQMVSDTLRYNFGIVPDHFLYGRMDILARFIDGTLGGIKVAVGKPILDHCSDVVLNYLPGAYDMDGKTALCYARVRYADSDFERVRRQQEVLLGMRRKFLEVATGDPIGTAANLIEAYIGFDAHTSMGVADIFHYGDDILKASETIHHYRLIPPLIAPWTHTRTGAYLLIPPDQSCLQELIERAASGQPWFDSENNLTVCQ